MCRSDTSDTGETCLSFLPPCMDIGPFPSLGLGVSEKSYPDGVGLWREEVAYLSPKSWHLSSENHLQLIRGLFSQLLRILNTFSFTSVTS